MPYQTISVTINKHIATITLERESKLNALNHQTLSELKAAFTDLKTNDDVSGILLTGSGSKAFAAGADISEIQALSLNSGRAFARFGQEHGQRPAAAAAVQQGIEALKTAVEMGHLLPVDLDGHEPPVDRLRDLGILETLPGHHVAPVAGAVTDGEEDGFVLPARLRERLLAPGVPIHGVVQMLFQIGGALPIQVVGEAKRHRNEQDQ